MKMDKKEEEKLTIILSIIAIIISLVAIIISISR
jgi:heme/copper-type cytochrome/quinol oxidase subunit 4